MRGGGEVLASANLVLDAGRGAAGRQFPAREVNTEMRLPHGSDWPSIREAGREPGGRRNPTGAPPGAGSYGQRTANVLQPSSRMTKPTRVIGLPKMGTAYGAGGHDSDRSSPPRNPVDRHGPTAAQHEHQERGNRPVLSADRRSPEQVPTAGTDAVGLPKKQVPGGKPRERLTWARRFGR
jgi:hypothetical protein